MIKRFLGDKNFFKSMFALSIPIVIQNMLVSSFSLIDTLMVSQLGDIELSAVGMAGQWSWMMTMVLFGISSGMSIFVSQFWGVRNTEGIHKSISIALTAGILVSVIFALPGAVFPGFVMNIFTSEEAVLSAGAAYLRLAALSYPAVAITQILSTSLRSAENVKLPMYVSLATTLANAFLNYSLIFGKFGFPEMGISGAALATCISSWAGPVLTYAISISKKNIIAFSPKVLFKTTKADVRSFLAKALPVAANESFWGCGTLIFNIIYSNLGYEYYAAITILRTFENIAFVFFIGLCNACAIMVGKAIGRGDIEGATRDAKRFAVLEPLLAVVVGAVMIISRRQLVNIFNLTGNISQTTLDMAVTITVIYAAEIALRNLPYIQIVGIFRAGGDAATAAKYDLMFLWLFSLPITLLNAYVFRLPFPVIFALMYVCEDVPKSVMCVRHFLSGKWMRPVTDEGKAGLERFKLSRGGLLSLKRK